MPSGETTSFSSCRSDASSAILHHTDRGFCSLSADWRRSTNLSIKLALYCKRRGVTSEYTKLATEGKRHKG